LFSPRRLSVASKLDYNARWYDPTIAHFVQADSIVPGGVQGYDRYAYVNNNPIAFGDPSGHSSCADSNWDDGPECAKKEGTRLNIDIKNREYQGRCARGEDPACPGGIKAGIAWFGLGVATAGVADFAVMKGGIADAMYAMYHASRATLISMVTAWATKNPDSPIVSLGSNGAYQNPRYTYFELPQRAYEALKTVGLEEPVNRQFVLNQIEQGKDFGVTVTGKMGLGTQLEIGMIKASELYNETVRSGFDFFFERIH
jgi:RHS repeat-associated protein